MRLTKKLWVLIPTIFWGLFNSSSQATPQNITAVNQTQTKLLQLDARIHSLQKKIVSVHHQKGSLTKELSITEKQIGKGVLSLRSLQNTMSSKEQRIIKLQDKISLLNQQLTQQQHLLAQHIRARYQMGEYQPLKWVLNQDDPIKISHMLSYYQYLINSRKSMIDQIGQTQRSLNDNRDQLNRELSESKQLNHRLSMHQEELVAQKKYHTTLIKSLDSTIENHQHHLQDAKKNKENLQQLLQTLAQKSVVQHCKPFNQMRKKLPLPVQVSQSAKQRMNQGLTFFAAEGAPVTAVYPGKIVFSDWLRGYGLLLIIDHGHGYMTLYAHNQSLFKSKGQQVAQNEQIASVGHSGGLKQNGLYFEIRLRGKTVSPLEWFS